jgi:hypothetical protein
MERHSEWKNEKIRSRASVVRHANHLHTMTSERHLDMRKK